MPLRFDTVREFLQFVGKSPNSLGKGKVAIAGGYRSKVQGWRMIGGKEYYFKSLWEMNYARYLEWKKQNGWIEDWWYEPILFPFPKEAYRAGPFYYKPDFLEKISKGKGEWYEIKGWMNPASKKKLKRFAKHYPNQKITVVGAEWFKKFNKTYRALIPGWETFTK